MAYLRARLAGVVIEKQLEPSHELLDNVSQQWEIGQLKYMSPQKYSSREFEVTMSKNARQISLNMDKMMIKESKSMPA